MNNIITTIFFAIFLLNACSTNTNINSPNSGTYRTVASETESGSCIRLMSEIIETPFYNEEAATILNVAIKNFIELPEVHAGQATPNWNHIDALDKLLAAIKTIDDKYQFPSNEDRADFIHTVLANSFSSLHEFKDFISKLESIEPKKEFYPTEYELISIYRAKFEEFNSYLPANKKFILKAIPENKTFNETLIAQAKEVVTNLAKRFEERFPESSGYKSYNEFLEAINNNKDVIGKELVETILDDDKTIFCMRRPINARWWIPKVGFHNQFITKSSQGAMNNDIRNNVEHILSHYVLDEYVKFNNDLKPKYGYLAKDISNATLNAIGYGEDLYTFKKKNFSNRITFTSGDSLIAAATNINIYKPQTELPTGWDFSFKPWNYRGVAIPFTTNDLKVTANDVKKILPDFKYDLSYNDGGYVEIQYWGPTRLSDVESFTFTTAPPTGEFLDELVKNNVKIYDGTNSKSVKEWAPPVSVPSVKTPKIPVNKKIPANKDLLKVKIIEPVGFVPDFLKNVKILGSCPIAITHKHLFG